MHTRTKELDTIMRVNKLTPTQVGEMLNRTPQTVRVWRAVTEDRIIPEHALEVLRLRLELAAKA